MNSDEKALNMTGAQTRAAPELTAWKELARFPGLAVAALSAASVVSVAGLVGIFA